EGTERPRSVAQAAPEWRRRTRHRRTQRRLLGLLGSRTKRHLLREPAGCRQPSRPVLLRGCNPEEAAIERLRETRPGWRLWIRAVAGRTLHSALPNRSNRQRHLPHEELPPPAVVDCISIKCGAASLSVANFAFSHPRKGRELRRQPPPQPRMRES